MPHIFDSICIISPRFFLTTYLLFVEIFAKSSIVFDGFCYRFKSLKHYVATGGSVSLVVMEKWKHITKLDIYEGYGKTEIVGW